MPTYRFENKNTKEEWTEFMSISEMEKFLVDNPHVEQLVNGAPLIADPMRIQGTSVSKPSNGFRDILKEVKKAHPLGTGINTF
jgi:hypothetical protein